VLLVSRSGEVVSRGEIQKELWSDDTFVDFEHGINYCIKEIRTALGDNADKPHFVQTVPRRGYRFIATVGRESAKEMESPVAAYPPPKRWPLLSGFIVVVFASVIGTYRLTRPVQESRVAPLAPMSGIFDQITMEAGVEYFPSLSPDGRFVIYAGRTKDNWDIYLRRVGGNNAINLTEDCSADDTQPAFSPCGNQIAFRSEREGGGLFLMGSTGESVRRLTESGYNPAWSPDGKEIVFATEGVDANPGSRYTESQLCAANTITGEKWLVITEVDAVQPHWSPNGHRIAFWGCGKRFKERDIWTIPASGGEAVPVTNDTAVDWNPVWSPNGNYLYFSSDRGGTFDLWRVQIDEESGAVLGRLEPVTAGAGVTAQHVCFSKDGRRLAYSARAESYGLHKIPFDPHKETVTGQPVTLLEGSLSLLFPDPSPDGEWVVFATEGKWEDIAIVRADGTGFRKLTDDPHRNRIPRWSPDGSRIAFYSDRGGSLDIWTIHPDGSGLQPLAESPFPMAHPIPWSDQISQDLPPFDGESERFGLLKADWSPDEKYLAGGRELIADGVFTGIVVYCLESQRYRLLTDFGSHPQWLNDSRRLLFRQRPSQISVIDSRTLEQREVFSVVSGGLHFGLSNDNRTIYFSHWKEEADLWMLTLDEERE
jgi:Tol biopolymer transport system component